MEDEIPVSSTEYDLSEAGGVTRLGRDWYKLMGCKENLHQKPCFLPTINHPMNKTSQLHLIQTFFVRFSKHCIFSLFFWRGHIFLGPGGKPPVSDGLYGPSIVILGLVYNSVHNITDFTFHLE